MILLYVTAGGAIGAGLRYLTTSKATQLFGIGFPYSTMIVNILGSLLMGVLIEVGAQKIHLSQEAHGFLALGILGGFTTFSSFSLDTLTLFERGDFFTAALYVIASVALSLAAFILGMAGMRGLL